MRHLAKLKVLAVLFILPTLVQAARMSHRQKDIASHLRMFAPLESISDESILPLVKAIEINVPLNDEALFYLQTQNWMKRLSETTGLDSKSRLYWATSLTFVEPSLAEYVLKRISSGDVSAQEVAILELKSDPEFSRFHSAYVNASRSLAPVSQSMSQCLPMAFFRRRSG